MPYKDPEAQRRYFAEYRMKHREHRARIYVAWREKNREAWEKYQAEYRAANRQVLREKQKRIYQLDKGKKLAANRAWRKKNRQWGRENHWKHREKNLERARRHYQRNRARRLQQAKEYAEKNPHVWVKRLALRRLRIEATIENEHAIEHFVRLIRTSRQVACYYCGQMIPGRKAHIDHVVPLSRGGSHTPENLCASCQACNLEKSAKLLAEWKRRGQQLLPL